MISSVETVMEDCKEQAARRQKRHNSRLDRLGIPEEELLKQQQELFHKARQEQEVLDQQQAEYFNKLMSSVQAANWVSAGSCNPLHDGVDEHYE